MELVHSNISTHHIVETIRTTPFDFLIGTKMKLKDDLQRRSVLEEELIMAFQEGSDRKRKWLLSTKTEVYSNFANSTRI